MTGPAPELTDGRLLRLHPDDDCLVAARPIRAGEQVLVEGTTVQVAADTPFGHKVAARRLVTGELVRKCGAVIGRTTAPVGAGELLHLHNLSSNYLAAHLVGGASAGEAAASPGTAVPVALPSFPDAPAAGPVPTGVAGGKAAVGAPMVRPGGPGGHGAGGADGSADIGEVMGYARADGSATIYSLSTSWSVPTTWPGKLPMATVPTAVVPSRSSGSLAVTLTITPSGSSLPCARTPTSVAACSYLWAAKASTGRR